MIGFFDFLMVLVTFMGSLSRSLVDRLVSWSWKRPASISPRPSPVADPVSGPMAGALLDLCRSKPQLIVENALLRQQLIVLRRQVNRPQLTKADRALLVLLASRLIRAWGGGCQTTQPSWSFSSERPILPVG